MIGDWRSLLICTGMFLLPVKSSLAGLDVMPPALLLSSQGVASTTVQSTLDSTSKWETRLVRWSQKNGKDVLSPELDGRITPRSFELQSGQKQTIRVRVPELNRYYRLVIEQVPTLNQKPGVQVIFNISLPLYPAGKEPKVSKQTFEEACQQVDNPTDRPIWFEKGLLPAAVVLLPGENACVRAKP